MSAEIESLIRQALARQNAFDPSVRQGIYQSSRNALANMIAKHGALAPSVIEARYLALEATVNKIEQEFSAPAPAPLEPEPLAPEPLAQEPPVETPPQAVSVPVPPAPDPQVQHPQDSFPPNVSVGYAPSGDIQPDPYVPAPDGVQTHQQPIDPGARDLHANPHAVQTQAVDPASTSEYARPTPQFARKKRSPTRYIIWAIVAALMILVGWLSYVIATTILADNGNQGAINNGLNGTENAAAEGYVTILEPSAPGTLNTSGRATAEIVTDTADPFIRIMSVRADGARTEAAKPILLELPPGVLQEIAGKRATVEILAKSGDSSPATFSVSCEFGELGQCSRKRFRVGLQPEAIVFSISISKEYKQGQQAFLAINTDVTSAAAISGKGAQVDIIYARLRPSDS